MEKSQLTSTNRNEKVLRLTMDANFFFEKAMKCLDQYRYDKALKYLQRAVEYEPLNPVNYCNIAGIYSELGNYDESNNVLTKIITDIDSSMTECYFYMANNYANMDQFELAEKALLQYLEEDPKGIYLEETEEMIEFLSYELNRPMEIKAVKAREVFLKHDHARKLLEEGDFVDSIQELEALIQDYPDFLSARNNLALAYLYVGNVDKCMSSIQYVLHEDAGNLHGLCNLAIVYKQTHATEELALLLEQLKKVYPYHQEHVYKLALTLGILGEHERAYHHFKRLMKSEEAKADRNYLHYFAIASFNSKRFDVAKTIWMKMLNLDHEYNVAAYFIDHFDALVSEDRTFNYHYVLPFEEKIKELSDHGKKKHVIKYTQDIVFMTSLQWGLFNGDDSNKVRAIQTMKLLKDDQSKETLREFLLDPDQKDYYKRLAIFVLKSLGEKEPFVSNIDETLSVTPERSVLPSWNEKWQQIIDIAVENMDGRYDILQQHDVQVLWVEFLSRAYPDIPRIQKLEGWAAALEYIIAFLHSVSISFQELSDRYGVSQATIRKQVKKMDEVCGLWEKVSAILPDISNKINKE
ncbi:DDE transposase family protein [Longirhabdus pacifica]|uniref:DDE transposase family protein n=1 Tax=Longirhabdus pacifica TaxID=2305227 RepID=UPI0010090571|nr:DDE transposase family protein [Longirhabdus pacifica]